MNKKSLYYSANYLKKRFYILPAALALMLGGIIYILFRASEPIFFSWMSAVGLDNWINFVRHYSISKSTLLPEWIIFSLPNGLWAFGYALIISGIWSGSKSRVRYFWLASIPVLVLGYEVLQFAKIIPGTFCIQDIALGVAGLVIGITVKIIRPKSKNYEKATE